MYLLLTHKSHFVRLSRTRIVSFIRYDITGYYLHLISEPAY